MTPKKLEMVDVEPNEVTKTKFPGSESDQEQKEKLSEESEK